MNARKTLNRSTEAVRDRISNTAARAYFTHAGDDDEHGNPTMYFSYRDVWGFWVHVDGSVHADSEVGLGILPNEAIVSVCVKAAGKYFG